MKYDVIMRTQLGDRHGILELKKAGSKISGVLRILGMDTKLHGVLFADGQCRLEGTLQAAQPASFSAQGVVCCRYVDLLLHGWKGSESIQGIPFRREAKAKTGGLSEK